MSDLVEFLKARLDEDEQVARNAALAVGTHGFGDERVEHGKRWVSSYHDVHRRRLAVGEKEVKIAECRAFGASVVAVHIARHDPQRVLREVERGRSLITRYERAVEFGGRSPSGFVRGQDDGYIQGCLDAIKDTAAVHRDHSDYKEEWNDD